MDPIYSVGTSVSSYLSLRASETLSQRRGQTRSESSNSDEEANVSTSSEETENREEINDAINRLVGTIGGDDNDRIRQQAQRIQSLFQSPLSQSSNTAPVFSQSQNDTVNSISYELQTYLQIIRQFMADDEDYNKFLDQMGVLLSGTTGDAQKQGISDILSSLSSETGIATVQFQQTSSVQFQGQIVVRSGDEVRVIESRQAAEQNQQVQQAEPLVFDLDGDGLELTTVQDGVRFDIKGNGQIVQTAFVTGDDAFLALDRNGNGIIDSGKELFGDQHGAANGIEELRKFDDNHDGYIDSNDAVYDRLRLFVDQNGDGVSQSNELLSLQDESIARISLAAKEENQRISGNYMAASTYYERNNGSRNVIGEMYLNYLA